jgi:hypothetical protein
MKCAITDSFEKKIAEIFSQEQNVIYFSREYPSAKS